RIAPHVRTGLRADCAATRLASGVSVRAAGRLGGQARWHAHCREAAAAADGAFCADPFRPRPGGTEGSLSAAFREAQTCLGPKAAELGRGAAGCLSERRTPWLNACSSNRS